LPSLYGPQAHPPLLLLALSPIVRLVGGYWAYLLVTLATLGAAVVGTGLVLRWARPDDWRAWWWLCIVAAWGWQPTLAAVRQGQVGVIVACLLLGAWSAIRSRRDFTAGLLVGLATALKVYPVVFLSLLITRPRSIAGALLVAIGAGILLFLLAGLSELEAYRQSALLVVQKYGDAHNNWSLWTLLGLVGLPARSRWFVATISAILISVTTFLRRKSDRGAGWTDDVIDLRSGAAMCLAVLLSPIAWQHYFFLLLLPLWASARWLMLGGETAGLAVWCMALLVVSLPDTPFWLLDEAVGHSRLALVVVSPTTAIILIWATCLAALRQGKAEVSAFIPRTTTASA
jgi:alpha-1,2-mannosyltransferase